MSIRVSGDHDTVVLTLISLRPVSLKGAIVHHDTCEALNSRTVPTMKCDLHCVDDTKIFPRKVRLLLMKYRYERFT
jgi:hypothetical protein